MLTSFTEHVMNEHLRYSRTLQVQLPPSLCTDSLCSRIEHMNWTARSLLIVCVLNVVNEGDRQSWVTSIEFGCLHDVNVATLRCDFYVVHLVGGRPGPHVTALTDHGMVAPCSHVSSDIGNCISPKLSTNGTRVNFPSG
jgi:hypothetical protein